MINVEIYRFMTIKFSIFYEHIKFLQNFFQKVLKRSQKFNVNVQNINNLKRII